VRFQVLTVASIKVRVFWVIGAMRLINLMMEATRTPETSVNYQTASSNMPENNHLHPGTCLEKLRKTTKNASQDRRDPGRDLNTQAPEYGTRAHGTTAAATFGVAL
jgi:hypothetical protein